MEYPVQITFRNLDHSEEVESFIREKATRLDSFYDRIMSCRVMVEVPHQSHRSSNLPHIRIELTVPGGELAISRKGTLQTAQNQTQAVKVSKAEKVHPSDQNLYVAIRVAFEAARRQLKDYARRQRGEVKTHQGPSHGRVVRLFPAEEYGFLETPGGREIYFHKNSVLAKGFVHLEVGTEVSFTEEKGEKGAQASTVRLQGSKFRQ